MPRLLNGRLMVGEVRFRTRKQMGARAFMDLTGALERLAVSGQGWAREALEPESPFYFVSAAGFKKSFHQVRKEHPERPVVAWELEDLF